jgi:hypothetical protein
LGARALRAIKSEDLSLCYSHKLKQAGVNYELGISVFVNALLLWMNGPFKTRQHDITIFQHAGLQMQIPQGHCTIGNSGGIGESTVISTPYAHDPVAS